MKTLPAPIAKFYRAFLTLFLSVNLLYTSTALTFIGTLALNTTVVHAETPEEQEKRLNDFCSKDDNKDKQECKDREKQKRELEEAMVDVDDDAADTEDIEESLNHSNNMSIVLMIAIILSAIFFYISCVNQVSAIVYTLGGALYIILDAIGWSKLKSTDEFLKKGYETKKHQSAEDFDATTKVIEDANKELAAAQEHVNFRKTGAIITLVLFIIAFVLSILEFFIEVLTFGTKQSACYGAYGSHDQVPDPMDNILLRDRHPALFAQHQGHKIQDYLWEDVQPRQQNALLLMPLSPLPQGAITYSKQESLWDQVKLKNIVGTMLNSVLPKAHAAGNDAMSGILGTVGILGAIVVVILAIVAVVDGTTAVARKTSGIGRAIVIGIFIGILIYNIHLLSEASDKIAERQEKFNEILKKIKIKTGDVPDATTGVGKTGIGNTGVGDLGADGVPLPENAGVGTCVKTDIPNQSIANTDCTACASASCADVGPEADFSAFNGSIDVPGGVVSAVNDGRNGIKDLSNGKGLNKGLKQLGGQLNAVKKLMKDSQRSLNDLLKKKGQPTVNFKAEIKKLAGALDSGLTKAVAGFSPEQKAALDAYNKGASEGSDSSKTPEDDTFQKLLAAKNKGPDAAAPAFAMPKLGLDYGSGEGEAATPELNSADALAQYEIKQNDIHEDTGPNIFDIIAVRYRKTAYPVFFKKKEVAAPAAAGPAEAAKSEAPKQ